ncbi:MAG: murein biosynthesis integral membrane protein MurJ [Candidatus Pacebacteria bacterium]|nr:murein biosynthesis integral membrane protein MurJ [Candidatus Paceibacterota bacterium]MCF7863093.1 murein biosynthesis integral membrane protein MurJ [Candidatus Paceibacterota bacterium]
MEKILRIFNKEYGNLSQAAILLGSFTFLSQILGLFRDRSIAHFIGPSAILDTYYVAFRIPDLIFISFASLISVTVIIPFIVRRMSGEEITPSAQKFLSDIFSSFLLLLTLVSILAFVFMPKLATLVAPGFDSFHQEKVILLSRIMLLSPIFLGLSNLFGSITQIFQRFFVYSLSPILYNLGIILGVVFLYPMWGIEGVAIGVVLGSFLHCFIQLIFVLHSGFKPKFYFRVHFQSVKEVVLVSLPRTLGLSLNNIALTLIVVLASYLKSGSISIFNLSLNLHSVPLGIFGISYAVAVFPILSKFYSANNVEKFKENIISASRQIIFWSIPATFLFIVLRAQIVRVVLGSSSFSWDNTRLIAATLAVFSLAILAEGMIALFSRVYYAKGETKRPLWINLFSASLIVICANVFLKIFEQYPFFRDFTESLLKVVDVPGTEVLMLPLAFAVGSIINFLLYLHFIKRDFLSGEDFVAKTFFQSLGASFFMALGSYGALNFLSGVFGTTTFWGIFGQGLIAGIFGIMIWIFVLFVLKSPELADLAKTLKQKFWKTKVIAPFQEDL